MVCLRTCLFVCDSDSETRRREPCPVSIPGVGTGVQCLDTTAALKALDKPRITTLPPCPQARHEARELSLRPVLHLLESRAMRKGPAFWSKTSIPLCWQTQWKGTSIQSPLQSGVGAAREIRSLLRRKM